MSSALITEIIGRYFLTGILITAAAFMILALRLIWIYKKSGNVFTAANKFAETVGSLPVKKKKKIWKIVDTVISIVLWPISVHNLLWGYFMKIEPKFMKKLMES